MIWMAEHQIPFIMVFTKIDKLNKNQLDQNITSYKIYAKKLGGVTKNYPYIIKNKGVMELLKITSTT